MSFVALLASVPPFVVGWKLCRRALEARRAIGRVAGRRTRALAELEAGPVEVYGVLRADGPPLESLAGIPVVAARHVVHPRTIERNKTTLHDPVESTQATAARIEDGTGDAELDLVGAEILGERWVTGEVTLREFSGWGIRLEEELPPGTTHVRVEAYLLRDGAKALVSGWAAEVGTSAGPGYRGRARARFRLESEPEGALIVHAGREALFFARALFPALLTLASGLLLFLTGALLVAFAFL